MGYTISYVHGHVEVYDDAGRFVFSADDHREAMDEIAKRLAVFTLNEKDPAA